MFLAVGFVARHSVKADGVDAVENTPFNIRIRFSQFTQQILHFLPLAHKVFIAVIFVFLCKPASALNEFKVIVSASRLYCVLVNTVHGADEFHTLKIRAVKLRQHRLNL